MKRIKTRTKIRKKNIEVFGKTNIANSDKPVKIYNLDFLEKTNQKIMFLLKNRKIVYDNKQELS